MARAHGARSQMAVAFESTYGTPPGSGFVLLPFATSDLDSQQALLENELVGFGRDPLPATQDAIDVNGTIKVPMDAIGIGYWLKGLFGAPVTTGSSAPYTHTFNSGGWDLPSLAIEIGMPEVPSFAMHKGNKVNSLTFDVARKGLLTADVALIGQDEVTASSSAAASPAAVAVQRFNHFNGAISRNGVALGNIVSARFAYSNNLDPVEVVRGDGLIGGLDPGMAACSGQLVARFDSTTLLDQARNGEGCTLAFSYARPGADDALTFTVRNVRFSRPRREVTGPAGIQISLDWIAGKHTNGANAMVTAVLVNSRESY